ncbi:MAG: aminodeoxychorismate/anthranilate synthase component II [Candidatus Neomarinimicrobiota bacterium]
MILMLDNYDSFTYNLVQYAQAFTSELEVYRNDELTLKNIEEMEPEKIVISPGPGRPENAGISVDLVREFGHKIPILGVCLGHQAVAAAFNGRIIPAPQIVHGKTALITHNDSVIFHNIPESFEATRYHSLVVERETLPASLRVTAETNDRLIMALEHNEYPVYGVQFHPESIATEDGMKMIENFLTRSPTDRGGQQS